MFNIFKKTVEPQVTVEADVTSEVLADLLKLIVLQLVDNPDDVEIREVAGDRTTVLEIKVNDEDMGKVIGKKGRIIKSIRVLLRAAAVHQGKSVSVELVG